MTTFLRLQRDRVEALFNRDRARFAECVVATLLGREAETALNPNAAWDLTFNPPMAKHPVRLEVKCSGAFLPAQVATKPSYRARAAWELPADKGGIEDRTFRRLLSDRYWDLLILARHDGISIDAGWYFWVLASSQVPRSQKPVRVHETHVQELGGVGCEPHDLRSQIEAIALTLEVIPQDR